MPPIYVAGYEESDASRAALRFATHLAESTGAEVIAASVYTDMRRPDSRETTADRPLAELADDAKAGAEGVLATADVPDVIYSAVGGSSPAAGLHQLAEDQRASLLVVGVTHRGSLGRVVPGSVGERLLQGAPCPVAVVPHSWHGAPVRTVAVAYDQNAESQAALHAGESLAGHLRARLILLAVHEPLMASAGAEVPVSAAGLNSELEKGLASAVQVVADGLSPGLHAQARVLTGLAGSSLVEACADGIDLLITGSRGYGPLRSVMLGGVSRHVVDHAPCPVIVIPRGVISTVVGEP